MNKPSDQQLIEVLVIMLNIKSESSLQIPDNLIEQCTEMCQSKKRSFKLTEPRGTNTGKTLSLEKVE